MFGFGVGNVLGIPIKGGPRVDVAGFWPDGVCELDLDVGEPDDDDLAQAIMLAEQACVTGAGDTLDVNVIGPVVPGMGRGERSSRHRRPDARGSHPHRRRLAPRRLAGHGSAREAMTPVRDLTPVPPAGTPGRP